jgi:membrane-associated phospholipid phosphatase
MTLVIRRIPDWHVIPSTDSTESEPPATGNGHGGPSGHPTTWAVAGVGAVLAPQPATVNPSNAAKIITRTAGGLATPLT